MKSPMAVVERDDEIRAVIQEAQARVAELREVTSRLTKTAERLERTK